MCFSTLVSLPTILLFAVLLVIIQECTIVSYMSKGCLVFYWQWINSGGDASIHMLYISSDQAEIVSVTCFACAMTFALWSMISFRRNVSQIGEIIQNILWRYIYILFGFASTIPLNPCFEYSWTDNCCQITQPGQTQVTHFQQSSCRRCWNKCFAFSRNSNHYKGRFGDPIGYILWHYSLKFDITHFCVTDIANDTVDAIQTVVGCI